MWFRGIALLLLLCIPSCYSAEPDSPSTSGQSATPNEATPDQLAATSNEATVNPSDGPPKPAKQDTTPIMPSGEELGAVSLDPHEPPNKPTTKESTTMAYSSGAWDPSLDKRHNPPVSGDRDSSLGERHNTEDEPSVFVNGKQIHNMPMPTIPDVQQLQNIALGNIALGGSPVHNIGGLKLVQFGANSQINFVQPQSVVRDAIKTYFNDLRSKLDPHSEKAGILAEVCVALGKWIPKDGTAGLGQDLKLLRTDWEPKVKSDEAKKALKALDHLPKALTLVRFWKAGRWSVCYDESNQFSAEEIRDLRDASLDRLVDLVERITKLASVVTECKGVGELAQDKWTELQNELGFSEEESVNMRNWCKYFRVRSALAADLKAAKDAKSKITIKRQLEKKKDFMFKLNDAVVPIATWFETHQKPPKVLSMEGKKPKRRYGRRTRSQSKSRQKQTRSKKSKSWRAKKAARVKRR